MLGGLLLLGLLIDALGRYIHLPRVTLLLVFGFLIGPEVLGLLPPLGHVWFPIVADMALVMVGFLIGGKLMLPELRVHGRFIFFISITVVLVTTVFVGLGLYVFGLPLEVALILGAISTATAPAATIDVVEEAHSEGLFTRTLLGIVALDDAWGLIVFSLVLVIAQIAAGSGQGVQRLLEGSWEIGGAVLVGTAIGLPMAFLSGRIRPRKPTLIEALGMVFLCGGLAIQLGVSFILAAIVMGAVVANLAKHHEYPFHAIEYIEWPFLILFFILAGCSLHIGALIKIGLAGTVYVVSRVAGRLTGGWLGGTFAGAEKKMRAWMGVAMMPQAGVAMGMVLLAGQYVPSAEQVLLPIVIGSTVIFELIGPILTRFALTRAGDVGQAAD